MTTPTIPTDWKHLDFENICEIIGGYAFKSTLMNKSQKKYQIIKMGNVYNNQLNLCRSPSYLDEIGTKEKKYLLKKGDILISLTGTIGKKDYGYIVQIDEEKNLLVNQRLGLLRSKNPVLPNFLFYKVKHNSFLDQFFDISKGGTGNQTNVSTSAIKQITLLLPPLPEQNRIVAILETWDRYIEKISRKIEIKKNVKKGLMQKLLTGEVRLKKFAEDWKTVKLGEIGIFSKGAGISKAELSSKGYNAIRYGEIYTRHHFQIKKIYSFISEEIISRTKQIKCGDIIFTGSGETIDEIGKSAVYLSNKICYAGGDTIIFSPKNSDSLFLTFLLNNSNSRRQLRKFGQGQSVVHIYKKDLETLKTTIPKFKKEQTAIANILTTADQEIESLENKKNLIKQQKKFLLNNLITGKIRLPEFIKC